MIASIARTSCRRVEIKVRLRSAIGPDLATKLLDTNVCVALMRHQKMIVERMVVETRQNDLRVSSITGFELSYGARRSRDPDAEMEKVRRLLSRQVTLSDFTLEDGETAGQVRADLAARGAMIGNYDLLIAGHALSRGWIMVTANTREFARVTGLVVEDWSRSPT